MLIGKRVFSGGVTSIPRVSCDVNSAMAEIDGFSVDRVSLKPAGGITRQGGAGALQLLEDPPKSVFLTRIQGKKRVLAIGSDQKPYVLDYASGTATWVKISDTTLNMSVDSRMCSVRGQVIVPTLTGLKRVDAYTLDGSSNPVAEIRPLSMPRPQDLFDGNKFEDIIAPYAVGSASAYRIGTLIDDCDAYTGHWDDPATNPTNTTRSLTTVQGEYVTGTGAIRIDFAAGNSVNGNIIKHSLPYVGSGARYDWTGYDWIALWIHARLDGTAQNIGTFGTAPFANCNLSLVIGGGTGASADLAVVPIPALWHLEGAPETNGWNLVMARIGNVIADGTVDLTKVQDIAIRATGPSVFPTGFSLCIDDVRMGMDSEIDSIFRKAAISGDPFSDKCVVWYWLDIRCMNLMSSFKSCIGDSGGVLSNWVINGGDSVNTNDGQLTWAMSVSGSTAIITLFKDGTYPVLTGSGTFPGTISLSDTYSVYPGMSGSVDVASGAVTDNDPGNYIYLDIGTEFEYSYAFAGRESRQAEHDGWVVSQPSYIQPVPVKTDFGSLVTYIVTAGLTAIGSITALWNEPYFLLFRRKADELAAKLILKKKASAGIAKEMFTDYGKETTLAVSDVVKGLTNEIRLDVDPAPTARYIIAADQRLYAACLGYDSLSGTWKSPTAIQASNYNEPWYWPATADADSMPGTGLLLDGYQVTGTVVTGLATWEKHKFVFLDNESFLLAGDSISTWQFHRLGSIGCASNRSVADCGDCIIWFAGNDFYVYDGSLKSIGTPDIDASLIDLTLCHDAVSYNRQYVFYCKYGSAFRLLIYSLLTNSWTMRTVSELGGLAVDQTTLYGMLKGDVSHAGYWLVSLLQGGATQTIWTPAGTYGNPTFEADSAWWIVSDPRHDRSCKEVVLDLDVPGNGSIDVQVYSKGAVNGEWPGSSAWKSIAYKSGACRYVANCNVKGDAFKIKVRYTGQAPPVINFIGLDIEDEALR